MSREPVALADILPIAMADAQRCETSEDTPVYDRFCDQVKTIAEWRDRSEMKGDILFRRGIWCVTPDGVDCITQLWYCSPNNFNNPHLIQDIASKSWSDKYDEVMDFKECLEWAKANLKS